MRCGSDLQGMFPVAGHRINDLARAWPQITQRTHGYSLIALLGR